MDPGPGLSILDGGALKVPHVAAQVRNGWRCYRVVGYVTLAALLATGCGERLNAGGSEAAKAERSAATTPTVSATPAPPTTVPSPPPTADSAGHPLSADDRGYAYLFLDETDGMTPWDWLQAVLSGFGDQAFDGMEIPAGQSQDAALGRAREYAEEQVPAVLALVRRSPAVQNPALAEKVAAAVELCDTFMSVLRSGLVEDHETEAAFLEAEDSVSAASAWVREQQHSDLQADAAAIPAPQPASDGTVAATELIPAGLPPGDAEEIRLPADCVVVEERPSADTTFFDCPTGSAGAVASILRRSGAQDGLGLAPSQVALYLDVGAATVEFFVNSYSDGSVRMSVRVRS